MTSLTGVTSRWKLQWPFLCMTFWEKAEKFSPCVVRLMARHPWGMAMTDEEIADRAGVSVQLVRVMSQLLDWHGVDMPTMRSFLRACHFDFEDRTEMNRRLCYLKSNPKWNHLRRSTEWQTLYLPLLRKWMTAYDRTT